MPEYKGHSDDDLLSLLKGGDHSAYTEIYDRYNGVLYVFAYRRLKNREEAKDLIHELFLKLWADRAIISERFVLAAYLYSSLRNRVINLITHQKVASRYLDSFSHYLGDPSTNNADYLVRHNELYKVIENEIANLNPRTRKVFELSRKMNLSRKEIAEKLDISEETVKSHMHSALRVLKVKLSALFCLIFLIF